MPELSLEYESLGLNPRQGVYESRRNRDANARRVTFRRNGYFRCDAARTSWKVRRTGFIFIQRATRHSFLRKCCTAVRARRAWGRKREGQGRASERAAIDSSLDAEDCIYLYRLQSYYSLESARLDGYRLTVTLRHGRLRRFHIVDFICMRRCSVRRTLCRVQFRELRAINADVNEDATPFCLFIYLFDQNIFVLTLQWHFAWDVSCLRLLVLFFSFS